MMPVLSESESISRLREEFCRRGVSNSLCPPREKSAAESRQVINEFPTSDQPVHNANSPKSTITYQQYLQRHKTTNPDDIILEHEIERSMMNDLENTPTQVLEAELRKRREKASGDVTDEELDRLSAAAFHRPAPRNKTNKASETGSEPTDEELDRLSARAFGRKVQ